MSYFPVFTSYILYQIVLLQKATIIKKWAEYVKCICFKSDSSLYLYKAADKVCFSQLDDSGNSTEICPLSFQ